MTLASKVDYFWKTSISRQYINYTVDMKPRIVLGIRLHNPQVVFSSVAAAFLRRFSTSYEQKLAGLSDVQSLPEWSHKLGKDEWKNDTLCKNGFYDRSKGNGKRRDKLDNKQKNTGMMTEFFAIKLQPCLKRPGRLKPVAGAIWGTAVPPNRGPLWGHDEPPNVDVISPFTHLRRP
eukprot:Gb_08896 [translate_table: standard]